MKAIRVHEFGPPEVMKLEDTADLTPGPGQVVVRVKAIGVNPVDTYIRSGTYARKPALPYTPGTDAAGIIDSVGQGVSHSVGARVYVSGTITGAYAEQVLCHESDIHPLWKELSFSQGAAINVPYATAYRALFQRADAKAGEAVLVHGATGGVGIAATQLARAAGLKVFGTGGTAKGRELVLQQGADDVFDHTDPNCQELILSATGGRGVDIVLEMLANVNLDRDLKILAAGGRVVIVGSRGRVEIDPRDTMTRDAMVLGMLLANTPQDELVTIHSALAVGFESGSLHPFVGKEMPLADAPLAHKTVMQPGAYGKIVLMP